ncbi:MAG: hypothetical protein Q3996_00415 [Candidatus Saccharibacteria bacterium]|nr:hypothetical protein [Candidatus Saccharibacteria bacterium]
MKNINPNLFFKLSLIIILSIVNVTYFSGLIDNLNFHLSVDNYATAKEPDKKQVEEKNKSEEKKTETKNTKKSKKKNTDQQETEEKNTVPPDSAANFDIDLPAPNNQVDSKLFMSNGINRVFFWSGVFAVMAIIYGGITYTLSAGNAEKLGQAKRTIIYALIGLTLVVTSFTITNFVLNSLDGVESADVLAARIVNIMMFIIGVISVIMMVYAGILFVTSAGNANKVATAKQTIVYAVIGMMVAAVASAAVSLVLNQLEGK